MSSEPDILSRYHNVRQSLDSATSEAGRPLASVALVAVSKTHEAERIRPVLTAGQRIFGENKVQEAAAKWPGLRQDFPDVELHLIGPLQSNKVKEAVALFDVIETLDRPKLARALAKEMARTGRALPCFVQVNTGREPQKAGVTPEEAEGFIALCRDELGLKLRGLMCIPPVEEDPRPHFALLRSLAQRHGLADLSMGMSSDYPAAIAEGATLVRVGTAIFGAR